MDTSDYSPDQIINALNTVRKESDLLLVGLTGGIASGKSTVADMFKELGFCIIDFDVLARYVEKPGKPSWKHIVDYFGKDILLSDNSIDRKQLSNIVFSDKEKRRKLESFTHPFIWKEFIARVKEISSGNKGAVIFAVVPLLVECSMEDIFDRIVLVYTSPELQIERLIERDSIDRQKAMEVLKSQIPIDEKKRSADYIIQNGYTLDKTEKEVKNLWIKLRKINHSHRVSRP